MMISPSSSSSLVHSCDTTHRQGGKKEREKKDENTNTMLVRPTLVAHARFSALPLTDRRRYGDRELQVPTESARTGVNSAPIQ